MQIIDPARVGECIAVEAKDPQQIIERIAEAGAILQGHFALQSGRHSEFFLRFRQIGRDEGILSQIIAPLLDISKMRGVELGTKVLCPESAGVYLGRALATATNAGLAVCRVDRNRQPAAELSNGALTPDEPVLLVNDVTTSGRSLTSLISLARSLGAKPSGVIVLATLDPAAFLATLNETKLPGAYLIATRWPTSSPEECRLCREGVPLLPASELN